MKKDYSELLRRLECGPMDGVTRDAAFMAIRELVAERDARDAAIEHVTPPIRPKPAGSVTLAELDAMIMRPGKEPGQ